MKCKIFKISLVLDELEEDERRINETLCNIGEYVKFKPGFEPYIIDTQQSIWQDSMIITIFFDYRGIQV